MTGGEGERPAGKKIGWFLPVGIFLLCLFAFTQNLTVPGFTWDEAETNFPAARNQAEWFRGLASGETGFTEESVRKHFQTESDHPSLPRTLMALSRVLLPESVSDRFAFRLPTALLVSLFTAFFVLDLRKYCGRAASYGALFLLVHPRWFGHAQLAEYDILIAIAWWFAAMGFYSAFRTDETTTEETGWRKPILAALLFGLALSTKLHAFFIPFPLLAWVLIFRKWGAWRWAAASAILGPAVYLLTQPYLWWDTFERLQNRFLDYSEKVPITTYYLGEWFPGTVPWHYPWVMLAVTAPIGFLLLTLCGLVRWGIDLRHPTPENRARIERLTFFVLNAVATPLLFSWKSPYDGIRLFLVALPFLAAILGEGIQAIANIRSLEEGKEATLPSKGRKVASGVIGALLLLQLYSILSTQPFHLAYYSPLVGGIQGANARGFETIYWCEGLHDKFVEDLAREFPGAANIHLHAMDDPPLKEHQREGRAPAEWRFNQPGLPDLHLIQFRQGFFGPMEKRLIASDYEIVGEVEMKGIPLMRAYRTPK